MPLIATRGAASVQGFGEFAQSGPAIYIEDVFSTYLYTGNGSTQTITNNIDLSTKGGLVWAKERSNTGTWHQLRDTVRGGNQELYSNDTSSQGTSSAAYTFLSSGYSIGGNDDINLNTKTYASWTFREQPKFFDIVTYTGNGTSGRTVAHNLGSTPGCIIVKRLDLATQWYVYHRSLGATKFLELDATTAETTGSYAWNDTAPTSTNFTVGNGSSVNANGGTYVAYLFAHDAGGFGLTGSDNVISCGSWTGNTSVNLGYEPQWILIKRTDSTSNWFLLDVMRGWTAGGILNFLLPNSSAAESTSALSYLTINSTGFAPGSDPFFQTGTFIYIAIRRGPMKTPTTGTSVFAPYVTNTVAASSSGSTSGSALYRSDFVTDFVIQTRKAFADSRYAVSRLTGNQYLVTNSNAAEATSVIPWDSNIAALNFTTDYGQWMFRRAPGFFDVVCYTGTGSNLSVSHNLGAVPELIWVKRRNGASATGWLVYSSSLGFNSYRFLNDLGSATSPQYLTATSSSTFTLNGGGYTDTNASGNTYVAYLFASCPGVSKVGSYTGTGALQTVNCGFTAGARFVLIKRTDIDSGGWYVYDSARGISSGNDPYLFLNDTAAEVTGTNYVDTTSVGFQVTAAAPAGLNANGGTYIFLAIA